MKAGVLVFVQGVCALKVVTDSVSYSAAIPRPSVIWPKFRSGSPAFVTPAPFLFPPAFSATTSDGSNGAVAQALADLNEELDTASDGCASSAATGVTKLQESISITIKDTAATLNAATTEGYTLSVDAAGLITVTADNEFGGRQAIVSLHNMMQALTNKRSSGMANWQVIPGDDFCYVLPFGAFDVSDSPRLPHRGIMVDTARGFVSKDRLLRIIKTIARSKMNVLHWHATDDQSFPLIMENSAAAIHGGVHCREDSVCKGAFSNNYTYDATDMADLRSVAATYGVRVVLEIDQPAHARSWGSSDQATFLDCYTYEFQNYTFCQEPICGPLNLKNNYDKVWSSLGTPVVTDMLSFAAGEHIHIGMDEISAGCWGATVRDEKAMAWLGSVLGMTAGKSKVIVWEDGLNPGTSSLPAAATPSNVIAQVWSDPSKGQVFVDQGFEIVWSPYNATYLDCGRGNPAVATYGSWCDPYHSWWTIYKETPDIKMKDTTGAGGKVIGMETPLWAEQTNDLSVETLLFPRAQALAGALWEPRTEVLGDPQTPEQASNTDYAVNALQNLTALLHRVDIPYTALQTMNCLFDNATYCNSYSDGYYVGPSAATPNILASAMLAAVALLIALV